MGHVSENLLNWASICGDIDIDVNVRDTASKSAAMFIPLCGEETVKRQLRMYQVDETRDHLDEDYQGNLSDHEKTKWGLAAIAILLGVVSVIAALGICFVTYNRALDSTEQRYQQFYLEIARVLAEDCESHVDRSGQTALANIKKVWEQYAEKPADAYVCVIDGNANLILHTAHPDTAGNYAGGNKVLGNKDTPACSLGELSKSQADYAGGYISSSGQSQIAAFVAVPGRGWTVGVHRSREALLDEVRSGLRPLFYGMIMVCGGLIPISMFLLFRTFHLAQKKGKQAKEEIRKNEKKYRSLLENLPQKIFYKDINSVYVSCNKHYADDLGIGSEAIVGKTDFDFYPRELAEKYRADDKRLMEFGEIEEIEEKYVRDNQEMTILTVKIPVFDESGNVIGIQGVFSDITTRKLAEEDRKRSMKNLLSVFNAAPVGMMILDANTAITNVNDAVKELCGKDESEIVGRQPGDVLECVHRLEDPQGCGYGSVCKDCPVRNTFEQVLETGVAIHNVEVEVVLLIEDSEVRLWVNISAEAVYIDGVRNVVLSLQNITERKTAENALRRASDIIDQSHAVAFTWKNAEGWPVEYVSKNVIELFGWSSEDFMSGTVPYSSVVHPVDLEHVGQEVAEASDDVNIKIFSHDPYRIITKDGQVKWIEDRTTIHRGEDGSVFAYNGILLDITARKRAEDTSVIEKNRANNILEGTNAGTWDWNIKTGELTLNERWAEIIGYSLEELGVVDFQGWAEKVHPDDLVIAKEMLDRHSKGELDYYDVVFRQLHKDGSWVWVNARGKVVERTDDGKPLRMSGTHLDISERKRAEEELSKSKGQAEQYLNIAEIGLVMIGSDENIALINRKGCKALGYEHHELIGKNWFDLMVPQVIREEVRDVLGQLMKGDIEPVEYHENPLLTKEGEERSFSFHNTVIRDANDKICGILFSAEDITERKAAEEALRASEGKYRLLLNSQTDLVVKIDSDGRFLFVSPSYCKVFDKTEDELLGKTFMPLVHEDDREHTAKEMEKLHRPPYSVTLEQRVMTSSGWRWFEWADTAILNDDDEVIEIIGVGRDVTERKRAEEENSRLASILEATSDLVATSSLDKHLTYMNQAGKELLGLAGQPDVTQIEIPEVHPGWVNDIIANEAVPTAIKEGLWEGETAVLGVGGEEIPVSQVIMSHKTFDGNVEYMSTIMRDISERKQADLEREQLLKTLSAKNKEMQSIVYTTSHDLKSPLVNINGFSKALDMSCEKLTDILKGLKLSNKAMQPILSLLEEDIPQSLEFISASESKMMTLLDGLLHVSRVGSAEIEIEDLDMNLIVKNVCDAMEFQVSEAGVEVSIDELPGCVGDANMIDQLFSNLVGNAFKYLDPKRKGKIHISGTVDDGQSIYCVTDNGIGIEEAHQPKVFELFHRLHPDDEVGGEGLGLTIVTRILDRNDGSIWVESEAGKGSKFFVSLPTCSVPLAVSADSS